MYTVASTVLEKCPQTNPQCGSNKSPGDKQCLVLTLLSYLVFVMVVTGTFAIGDTNLETASGDPFFPCQKCPDRKVTREDGAVSAAQCDGKQIKMPHGTAIISREDVHI
jgi:hypothetical protein